MKGAICRNDQTPKLFQRSKSSKKAETNVVQARAGSIHEEMKSKSMQFRILQQTSHHQVLQVVTWDDWMMVKLQIE